MPNENAGVVILATHEEAEAAVRELQRCGFDMKRISIVGRDYHTEERVVGYYNAGDRIGYWGKQGAFWGGLWSLLFGSAFLLVPGLGPVLMAGPLVSAVVAGAQGALVVGGFSALGAALYGVGIPEDSILEYEVAVKSDKFVLMVHGPAEEVARAAEILAPMSHEVKVHRA